MQAKRRRISMANISPEPRPEERSLRRSVSKDASVSASFETALSRAALQNEVCGRIVGAFFGRCGRGALLLSGLSAAALACAASLAFADAAPAPGVPIPSPEAPVSFGDLADASPLFAVFTAAHANRSPALDL